MVDPQSAHDVLLALHIVAGTAGLALGPLAMMSPKRHGRHPRVGVAYQVVLAVLTLSALGLALLDMAQLWWLGLIAVLTEAAALSGWWARRRQFSGWLAWHVRLMCGSYVSLVTALLVVSWDSPLAWLLPTAIGSPLIAWATARATTATTGTRGTTGTTERIDARLPISS